MVGWDYGAGLLHEAHDGIVVTYGRGPARLCAPQTDQLAVDVVRDRSARIANEAAADNE
jgi:hypothetical protein